MLCLLAQLALAHQAIAQLARAYSAVAHLPDNQELQCQQSCGVKYAAKNDGKAVASATSLRPPLPPLQGISVKHRACAAAAHASEQPEARSALHDMLRLLAPLASDGGATGHLDVTAHAPAWV
jgi:hypothetical protein